MRWFEQNIIAPLDRFFDRVEDKIKDSEPHHMLIAACLIALGLGLIGAALG